MELRVLSHEQLSLVDDYGPSVPSLDSIGFTAILAVMTVVELVVGAQITRMFD